MADEDNSLSNVERALHSPIPSIDEASNCDLGEGMDPAGYSGPPEQILKPLTQEALAAYQAAQDRAGVIYISRIPPGMRPAKVRHLMNQHGEVGRVYLQQEDAKRAYLRKKFTSTNKAHFTEGWVEFKDKKVARAVADLLNAQPIGGKKGSRWRDDVWTMKYLPKFKWHMLTEQVAHEGAIHAAKLRVELSQSRAEQQEYLHNVELARILDKRTQKRRAATTGNEESEGPPQPQQVDKGRDERQDVERQKFTKKRKTRSQVDNELEPICSSTDTTGQLVSVLHNIF